MRPLLPPMKPPKENWRSFSEAEKAALFQMLGLGALKYYLLKVDPQKRMQFNPAESVDLHGNTGPYIQYVHARIQSILRKAAEMVVVTERTVTTTTPG